MPQEITTMCGHTQLNASVDHPDQAYSCGRLKGHTGVHGVWSHVPHSDPAGYVEAVKFMEHSAQLKDACQAAKQEWLHKLVKDPGTEYHLREHAKAELQRRVWVDEQAFRKALIEMSDDEVATQVADLAKNDPARLRRWALREQHFRAGRISER